MGKLLSDKEKITQKWDKLGLLSNIPLQPVTLNLPSGGTAVWSTPNKNNRIYPSWCNTFIQNMGLNTQLVPTVNVSMPTVMLQFLDNYKMPQSIVTIHNLKEAFDNVFSKYNLVKIGEPISISEKEGPNILIEITVNKISNYLNICHEHNWYHNKLTAWLQELFDTEILPYKMITHQYIFQYVWDSRENGEKVGAIIPLITIERP